MSHPDRNDTTGKKKLHKILLIAGSVAVIAGVAAVLMELWMGLAVIVGGALLGLSGGIGLRTVNARYDPMVENGANHAGDNIRHHPQDVPLNPWDTITGNEGQNGS